MKKIKLIFYIIIIFLTMFFVQVYSQFIEDSDDMRPEKKEEDIKKSKKELPIYIAFHLQAERLRDSNDSIKITWSKNKNYNKDFIVGRSNEPINTRYKARLAKSIKVLNSKSVNTYIDRNLKKGAYYYVILAKERIASRDIELYKDVNYTSLPVIIGEDDIKVKSHVDRIAARKVSDINVLVTWTKLEEKNILYIIYRNRKIIDSLKGIAKSEKVGEVIDTNQFSDKKVTEDGNYYYAVTVKYKNQNELIKLIPDDSYTTTGVYWKRKSIFIGTKIRTKVLNHKNILIQWDKAVSNSGLGITGYEIYRSNQVIDSAVRLGSSDFLGRVDSKSSNFIDRDPGEGKYYYAVIVRFIDGTIDYTLKMNENYTVKPISLIDFYEIEYIKAGVKDNKIVIKWEYSGSVGNDVFRLYKSRRIIRNIREVSENSLIKVIKIRDGSHEYEETKEGRYYYCILPQELKDRGNYRIIIGKNITEIPISLNSGNNTIIRKIRKNESFRGNRINPEDNFRQNEKKNRITGVDSVDIILNKTFFKGKYKRAIKALQNMILRSDNEYDIAKAKLFIGRSFIEIEMYSRAFRFLIKRDVKKHFPEESKFWREFALIKIH